MDTDNVNWKIKIDGFTSREDARKIAALVRRATNDNHPENEIRIDIQGYIGSETQ